MWVCITEHDASTFSHVMMFEFLAIVHCVLVSLTGATVAAFGVHVSLVGIALYTILTLCNIVDLGAPHCLYL